MKPTVVCGLRCATGVDDGPARGGGEVANAHQSSSRRDRRVERGDGLRIQARTGQRRHLLHRCCRDRRRRTSDELKFQIDAFTRESEDTGAEEAGQAFAAYLQGVEKADADGLRTILYDQFVIVSGTARETRRVRSPISCRRLAAPSNTSDRMTRRRAALARSR